MPKRKILLVNKFYHDVGPAGGVGRYLVQEEADLTAAGWDVIPFAMADADARPTPWDRYFVRARDYSSARFSGGAAGDALSLIWNGEAAAKLDSLIREARPDVAHLHNIYHHLSPSILSVLREHRIPTVMTLHDLRLLCPAIHMLRDRQVCEKCKGGRLHNAVVFKCVKDSRAASLLAAVETFHQKARRLYPRTVARFLCPSRFIRDKYIAWGYPADTLHHLPNFVDLEAWHPARLSADRPRDAIVYFGRISTEKGLRDLLEAQALWEQGYAAGRIDSPPLKLIIAGEGPCAGNLQARMAQLELQDAVYMGGLTLAGLREVLGRARFTVLPSICYENGPMAALESLAAGIPLLGTDIGGIPEMIREGVTGVIVPPGNPRALLAGMRKAAGLDDRARAEARSWAERNADRGTHMARLEKIFLDVMS
jgi:glycosyltransferase involved in cell wall biosynthesis